MLITRRAPLRQWVLGFAGVVETMPSLALFGFLISIPLIGGIGARSAIIALCLYALLPILRNSLVGILGVDPAVRESAVAMGMTGRQLLWQVEMPLAAAVILAGLRISTVTTIGTATIAAAIGGGGLGVFIFRGIAPWWTRRQILAGAVPAAVMALLADGGTGMDRTKIFACLTTHCGCLSELLLSSCSSARPTSWSAPRISPSRSSWAKSWRSRSSGASAFPSSAGSTWAERCWPTRRSSSGYIDLYPEYTGTACTNVLKLAADGDRDVILNRVRAEYAAKWKLEWLDPLGFNDPFAMIVRGPDARAGKLQTLSQAAEFKKDWALGASYEFADRPDGLPALMKTYQLGLRGTKFMDLGLLYKALEDKQVDMIAGNLTDGRISAMDVTVLEDDQKAFPPYDAALVVRSEALAAHPGLRKALQELSGKFSGETMRRLNYEVDGKHRAVSDVAAEFLKTVKP